MIKLNNAKTVTITLPQSDVFEDTGPRLLDADGSPEVVVVQSNARLGAKLAIYDETGLVATTPNIGRSNRWLTPLGATDLDGVGLIELAYIDRPHFAKTLMIWRFESGELRFVSELAGYTNHRIGERDIAGGISTCNGMPEMIVAGADWAQMVAMTLDDKGFVAKTIGQDTSRPAFAIVMTCDD